MQASVHSAFLEKGEMESVGQINAKKTQFIEVRPITNITFAGSEEEDIYLYE